MTAWPDIRGWCADCDRQYLYEVIVSRGYLSVVEIGVYAGRMTAALAAAVRQTGGMLHCVDHWREMANGGDIAREFLEMLAAHDLQDVVRIYCEASATFAERWRGDIDLLWIDGGHAHPVVLADLCGLAHRSRAVFGHDGHLPGVRQAATEYAAKFGLTVVWNPAGTDNIWTVQAPDGPGRMVPMG